MPKYQTYKDLEIYRTSHKLAVEIHRFTLELPKYEQYEIGSQLRRSSKSVSANIVEGFGRKRYIADYIRFLIFAMASNNETIEWIEYIRDCHQNFSGRAEHLIEELNILGRKLNRFIASIDQSRNQ